MKALLLINGIEGSERCIEDGFHALKLSGKLTELNYIYYEANADVFGIDTTLLKIVIEAESFQPQLIVFFHIGKFPITKTFVQQLKNILSKPKLIYDEGDMYGGWAKPITKSMEIIISQADAVSIRGFGTWLNIIQKLNKNIIYTPQNASISYLDQNENVCRKRKVVFIGNCIKSRLGFLRRLSGAFQRERYVNYISQKFPDQFVVYGQGWEKLPTHQGKLPYKEQISVGKENWFHFSYEHYPNVSYYFSDRLPIALMSGQIYICHYHKGYEQIFKNCDFIYFFKTKREAEEIIRYLTSLSDEELDIKSKNAKIFAQKFFYPEIVWKNFFNQIESLLF